MKLTDIREIALHQHLRRVDLVELRNGNDRVRIVIRSADGDLARREIAPSPRLDAQAERTAVTVKAEALGILCLSHPLRAPARVKPGEGVVKGQALGLLQLGEVYSAVSSPCDGVVESVLANEGDRIDFGTPLFALKRNAE